MTAFTFSRDFSNLERDRPDRRSASSMNGAAMGQLEQSRLRAVIDQAEQAGIQGSVGEILRDARLIELMARRYQVPVPSLDVCQHYYHRHLDEFREPDRVAGRQIVLPCAFTNAAASAEAWARAERLIAILYFDPGMFPDLLATYDCVTDGTGSGHIGPIAADLLPPALEAAFAGLRPGQVCPVPIATDRGLHVVVLDRIYPGPVRPFSAVHGRISAQLRGQSRIAAAQRHLSRLATRYLSAAADHDF